MCEAWRTSTCKDLHIWSTGVQTEKQADQVHIYTKIIKFSEVYQYV